MTVAKKGKRREPITQDRKDQIIALIARWKSEWGKLTGTSLEIRVEGCLGFSVTRQGMFKHGEIETAFLDRQKVLAGGKPKRVRAVGEELLQQQVKARDARIKELEQIVQAYEERFIRYHYNAKLMGVGIEDLEQSMPSSRED